GVELAGELLERKEVLCPKYHIAEDEVRVIVIEMMDTILPILPDKLRRKASRYIRRKGGEVMLNSPITKAEEGRIIIGDEEVLEADTFIWTAGIHGSEFTSKIELTKGQCASGTETEASTVEGIHGMAGCSFEEDERYVVGERGRILVNEHMQSVDFDNVYMAGDMIWYVHEEKVVPQIVETALQTAEVAAENVAAEIEKRSRRKTFKPKYHGFMVSLGGRWGVAHVVGLSFSGFMAMASKHLINMHYLFGLAGINAVWEYMQHEFFTIQHQRSFVGGHLSWKIPNYWALPLRIWLGAKWLSEGIKHIGDGWLNAGGGGLFNPDTSAIRLPGVSYGDGASAASPAADGGSAASPAAEGAAEGAAEAASEYGEPLIEALGIWTWFAESVLSESPALAFILQSLVVLAQVAMGLALIGGLFTFLASGVTILMALAFIASGWGNPELLWYIFSAIVMLGGAGRGFGLDHYVMPALHRWWNRTGLAHKTYLYVGEPRLKN
ncbi:MAG: NAD(P)/FAD-dependent oxidoreductase, partial [Spirochaetota bacterium]